MKALISSIGTRGDVQPILALAIELQILGHEARLCVAPNFKTWVESFGIECIPLGPDLRKLSAAMATQPRRIPSLEQRRGLAAQAARSQFPVITDAARGCDVVVAGGTLQLATRSVSEALKIPYVFVAYCPAVLPSPLHPPPKIWEHHSQSLSVGENMALWKEKRLRWNDLFLDVLNEERAKLGLQCIGGVHEHILTDDPWLAADSTLGPADTTQQLRIVQTGAWMLKDERPLSTEVEAFLAGGPPPVYFGFGSMRAAQDTSRVLVESARALGMRSIISQGWGDLHQIDAGSDCLLIDDVAHEKLFPRVAAVVHHGGAGTTAAASGAGVPQVIVPHLYDQYYWAHRVQQLGIGVVGPIHDKLNTGELTAALESCLDVQTRERARRVVARIERCGAQRAAERLIRQYA